jgi:predicted HicB family RNase H-like nuclease
MPPKPRKVLYVRDVPPDLSKKLKGAAALQGTSLQEYVVEVLRVHVIELERKGLLPKGK